MFIIMLSLLRDAFILSNNKKVLLLFQQENRNNLVSSRNKKMCHNNKFTVIYLVIFQNMFIDQIPNKAQ